MPSSSLNNRRRHKRRNYTSVANQDADGEDSGDDENFSDEPEADIGKPKTDEDHDSDDEEDFPLSLTILDSAQKKFPIPCDKNWTVGKFKRRSAKIHKVAPAQQRLIFRGKMLTNDDQTLEQNKLDTNDLIVHLFPKPRVVVTSGQKKDETKNNYSNSNRPEGADDDGDTGIVDEDQNGAHIPSIVINQEEQALRGQILVLGSVEIAESQNNVKMLSLLLVLICSMRLLSLFSIAMGAVNETTTYNPNSAVHNHTGDDPQNQIFNSDFTDDSLVNPDYELRSWQTQDYFDLLVSGIGFYVGTLGMKATQENTSYLATAYAFGTIIAGIGWNLWNVFEYMKFLKEQTESQNHSSDSHNSSAPNYDYDDDDLPEMTRDDFVTVAFFTILLPLFVWFLCCVRAFEFRRLIREAEEEAAERVRNEYVVTDGGDESANNGTEMV